MSNIILWEKESGKRQGAPDSTYILVNWGIRKTGVCKVIKLAIVASVIVLR